MRAAKQRSRATVPRGFKPYPAYKDSGVEWLGEIPVGWEVKRLRFVGEINPVPSEVRGLPGETEVSFVPMEAVGEHGGLSLETTKRLADVKAGYTYFRDGDIVIAKITPCFENGKGALAAGLMNGIAFGTTELHVLRATERTDRRFLFYVTLSDAFRRLGEADMYGAGGQKRVSDPFVRNFSPALPPEPEQRAIAAFLDRETARIDALVAKKQRLIALLQEQRTALITRAVTKGLDPTVPMKDSGVEWLGEIPARWEVKPNAALFRERNERGRQDLPILEVSIASGVRLREFSETKIEQRSDDLRAYKVARRGDIAFNKMRMWQGAVGGTPEDGLVSPDYIVAQPHHQVDSTYYTAVFRTPMYMAEVYRWSHGIVDDRNRLYWDDFKALRSPFPPPDEQHAIATFLDRETTRINALVAKVREAIERLKELRTALISAAVTGKIDVREMVA